MPRCKREQWQVREAARKTVLGNEPGKLVLGYLAERANADGYTHVHRETIVRETGVAMRTLQNMLRCLQEVGLLSYRRVNQAERMERGVQHKEEFQLHVDRLDEDTSAAFAVAYREVQHKKVAILPETLKSVAEALSQPVAAAGNMVGATEKSVAPTHPPHPLLGGRTQEHLSNTPLGGRWITAASEEAASGMGVVPSRWPALLPVIREALEQDCRRTGSSADDAAKRMVSARSRALEVGFRMKVDAWIADGHWLSPSLDVHESPAGCSATDTHEHAGRMSLADFNSARRAWKEPELTEAEYAKWL